MNGLNLIFLILYHLIVILTVVHVVMDNRQPAKTMAWILVVWFVPIVGIVFYLFLIKTFSKVFPWTDFITIFASITKVT